jgi:hypothetical protein
MTPVRAITILFALGAAIALVFAVQGGQWWIVDDGTVRASIGPISTRHCMGGGACRSGGMGWIGGDALWVRAGLATYVAGLVAAALMVFVAAANAAGRTARLAATAGVVAAFTAAVAGAGFVLMFPGVVGAIVDRGPWLYAGGIALVLAAAAIVMRRSPP